MGVSRVLMRESLRCRERRRIASAGKPCWLLLSLGDVRTRREAPCERQAGRRAAGPPGRTNGAPVLGRAIGAARIAPGHQELTDKMASPRRARGLALAPRGPSLLLSASPK